MLTATRPHDLAPTSRSVTLTSRLYDARDRFPGTTAVAEAESEKRPAARQQPKRQSKSQRKGGGRGPAGNQRAQNQKRDGNTQ